MRCEFHSNLVSARRDETLLAVKSRMIRVDDRFLMVKSQTNTQRAMTRLCLVVAVIFSILPAGGLVVCLGHDGHLGLALGVVATDDGKPECPCTHQSAVDAVARTSAESDTADFRHPPCDDVVLEPPEIFNDFDRAPSISITTAEPCEDNLPQILPSPWACENPWPDAVSPSETPWVDSAGRIHWQLLEQRRFVVLLI